MKDIINQWNNAATKYTKEQECSEFAESNKRVVKARFERFNGEKILDLGCGYGFYTDYFRSIGANAIGIDGSKKMIFLISAHKGKSKEKYIRIEHYISENP